MKRIKLLFILVIGVFLLSGCDIKDNKLTDAKIYTTIYPVEFITNYLYGENSTIESIYPDGVNLDNYSLTDKQIENYSKGDLFVYIGLSENAIANAFRKENDEILFIDATYKIEYNYNLAELWLAPNNFLTLAKRIRDSLNECLDNAVKEEIVNKKYEELYEKISWVDVELRTVAKEALENENNTLVVSSNTFKFLENYGFKIISLEELEATGSENVLNDIKSKFKNSQFSKILKLNSEKDTELIKELKDKYKASTVEINDLVTNSDSASNYISIQYENIALIRNMLK